MFSEFVNFRGRGQGIV